MRITNSAIDFNDRNLERNNFLTKKIFFNNLLQIALRKTNHEKS